MGLDLQLNKAPINIAHEVLPLSTQTHEHHLIPVSVPCKSFLHTTFSYISSTTILNSSNENDLVISHDLSLTVHIIKGYFLLIIQ